MSNNLGNKLKEFRETMGLSMSAFARKAGLDTPHYIKIERGETVPGFTVVQTLIDTYQIDPRYLFGSKEK